MRSLEEIKAAAEVLKLNSAITRDISPIESCITQFAVADAFEWILGAENPVFERMLEEARRNVSAVNHAT